MISLCKD